MIKPKIILIGAGGHCRSCIDVIEQKGRFEIGGIVDKASGNDQDVLGYSVIGTLGILLAAYKKGHLPDLSGVVSQLKVSGFRVSNELAASILKFIG